MFVKEALFGYVDHHASCGVENDDEASQASGYTTNGLSQLVKWNCIAAPPTPLSHHRRATLNSDESWATQKYPSF